MMPRLHLLSCIGALCCACCVGACAPQPPLPHYPRLAAEDSWAIVRERQGAVQSLSAAGTLVLEKSEGSAVRLEIALAARPPDSFRLRAWKLGRSVFDITLRGEEIWLEQSERLEEDPQTIVRWVREIRAIFSDELLSGGVLVDDSTTADTLVVRSAGADASVVICEIERDTLTLRRLRVVDAGAIVGELTFRQYRLIGNTPWPMRIDASGPSGTAALRLQDVELNLPLPDSAFTPPRRATQLQ